MQRIIDVLNREKATLLVSIPSNSVEPALAAQAGGADGIKVHVNVTHHATGVAFGSWEQEMHRIRSVIDAVNIPVGLVPGESLDISKDFLQEVASVGIQFVDMYSQFWPAAITRVPGIDVWAAFDNTYSLTEMCTIASFPWVDAVEASIIPTAEYGTFLSWRDLSRYHQLQTAIQKPMVIPSQRKIRPEDIQALRSLGLKNFLMGAVSIGQNPEQIEQLTREFRDSLDS